MGVVKFYSPVVAPSFTPTADGVTNAMLSDNVAHTIQVDLSAADIIGMNATPVEIIASPGAGKALIVDEIVFVMTRTSTAFTGGGAVSFRYVTTTTSVPHAGTIASTVVTGAAGEQLLMLGPNVGTNGVTIPEDEAIEITNATAAFAAGTGTAKVHIRFRVLTY